MKWISTNSILTVLLAMLTVYAKTQGNDKLFWFGLLMTVSFGVSIVIKYKKR